MTMSKPTLGTTSFKTPYVSLDLLSYLKSGHVTPFQIFNDVIMPDFKDHISKGTDNEQTQSLLEEIQNDLIPIGDACGRIQKWEAGVSSDIEKLAYQRLDDAFRERNEVLENASKSKFLEELKSTRRIVSELKESICSASVKLQEDTSKVLDAPKTSEQVQPLNKELPDTEAIYNDLDDRLQQCLLCFSMFPEGAIIKKKVLIHWWAGEGIIDTLDAEETAEEKGNKIFKEFLEKGIIEPFYKRSRPSADSCKMQPPIRDAVIKLAEMCKFFSFDKHRNPTTEDFSESTRACLVRTIEGSNIRELPFLSSQENVTSLINVSEHHLYFRPNWFSKMKGVKVLQLGRWRSDKHIIEVEDCDFLKGLKNMKELRYLSLRGVSRITELPASICKAHNLRILNLNGCCDLEKLPRGIGSLKNLTHLDMYECSLISGMPKGLALLSNLQVLKGFVISSRSGSQDCTLDELSKLESLRKLSIHIDIKKIYRAETELNSLTKFKKLQSLSISWSHIYDMPATQTLQTIRSLPKIISKKLTRAKRSTKEPSMSMPPEYPLSDHLEKLDLHYFPHSNMPNWLKPTLLNNLKKLYIRGGSLSDLCHNGNNCTWNVQMLRLKFLEKMAIDWKKLEELFPQLSYLEILECPNLSFDQVVDGVWKKEESVQVGAPSSNAQ